MKATIQYFPAGRWSNGDYSAPCIRIELRGSVTALGRRDTWIFLPWDGVARLTQ